VIRRESYWSYWVSNRGPSEAQPVGSPVSWNMVGAIVTAMGAVNPVPLLLVTQVLLTGLHEDQHR
jgi:hypothetical protein